MNFGLSPAGRSESFESEIRAQMATLNPTILIVGARILEVMFFTGLVGCAAVVSISWVSIFKTGFTAGEE